MAAITWRNVDGQSGGGEASAILQAANQSFNAGFGSLDRILKQRQAVDAQNWENTKTNNNAAIQARLASAKTPEELAAMEGEIAQMGAGMGAQVDPALLRDGMRNQMTALRTQTTQDREYANSNRIAAATPHREAYAIAQAKGDVAEMSRIAEQYDLGPDEAAVTTAGANALRQLAIQQSEDKLRPGDLQNRLARQEVDSQTIAADKQKNTERLAITAALNDTTKRFNESRDAQVGGLRTLAQNLGLSKFVDKATGLVDLSKLSDAQLLQYEAEAKKAGVLTDVDTGSAYISEMRKDLARQGLSAAAIEQATAEAQASIRGPGLSAEDAANLQIRLATEDAKIQKIKESNPAYEEPGQSQQAQVRIFEKIPELLSGDGTMTHNALKAKVGNWMNNGMKIAGEQVKIPARVIELALAAGYEKGSLMFNNTDTRMEKFIKDYMVSKEFITAKKEADLLLSGGYDLKKATLKQTALDKAGNVNGNDYIDYFTKTVEARKVTAASNEATKQAEAAKNAQRLKEAQRPTIDKLREAPQNNIDKLREQSRLRRENNY